MLKKLRKYLLIDNKLSLVVLLITGSLTWSLTMVKSGLVYQEYGMGFWGPHGHDGVWHIALAERLAQGSLEMPVFSGSPLQNYHIGYDLFLAVVNRITGIPIVNLYFQVLPVIISLLIGFLTYRLVLNWKKSEKAALWSTFFVYFGGSWGWIINLLREGRLGGESMFWSQQAISTLINPPFALSLVFILVGLIALQKKKMLITIISFALLSQIKAYAFVLCIGGLLIISFYEFILKKNSLFFRVFIGSIIIGFILFLPLNSKSSSLLIWQPFWFLETMLGLSDRFNWPKLYEAMMNYKLSNSPKLIGAYLIALAIFWFGNLGPRVVKEIHFIKTLKNIRQTDWLNIFSLSIIGAGIIIPTFFLQAGTPWNTIQFLYYSLFFSSLLAGVALAELKINKIVAVIIVLLTIPTSIGTLQHYLPARPPARISSAELEALSFLGKQPQGTVLTYPYDKLKADEAAAFPPRPLYLYESTAYVAAFSKQPVYLEDQVNLDIMQYPWKERREEIENFYKSLDEIKVREFLENNNISYIYWVKPQRATLGDAQLKLERIFENSEVDIWKVIK